MSRNVGASPSTSGVRPRMSKMYDGRNTATRPIPIITDTSELRAIAAAAGDQVPLAGVVNIPSGPRPSGAGTVFGSLVPGSTRIAGGVYNPAVGGDSTLGS